MYGKFKSMYSTPQPSRHCYIVESAGFCDLLYQGQIYFEDEIQHLIGIVFLHQELSNSSQVKSKLCVTICEYQCNRHIFLNSTLDPVMTMIY